MRDAGGHAAITNRCYYGSCSTGDSKGHHHVAAKLQKLVHIHVPHSSDFLDGVLGAARSPVVP